MRISKKKRQSIRYKKHDYSSEGSYFVTICARERATIFGNIVSEKMDENLLGNIVKEEWENITVRFPFVALDTFQVMPNHFHGILHINPILLETTIAANNDSIESTQIPAFRLWEKHTILGNVLGSFKSLVFHRYYNYLKDSNLLVSEIASVWQRNYWERIIRDNVELQKIRNYIASNPSKWAEDSDNLERLLARMEEKTCE